MARAVADQRDRGNRDRHSHLPGHVQLKYASTVLSPHPCRPALQFLMGYIRGLLSQRIYTDGKVLIASLQIDVQVVRGALHDMVALEAIRVLNA